MYWWNVSKLAEDLREGRVDEKERFKYFLASFIAWNVALLVFYYFGGLGSIENLVYVVVSLVSAIVGICLCYRANNKGDKIDFIPRMICLSWPVGIQLGISFSAAFLLLGIVGSLPTAALEPSSFLSSLPGRIQELWFSFLGVVFVWAFYHIVCRNIAFASKVKGAEDKSRLGGTDGPMMGIALGYLSGIGVLVAIVLTGVWIPISNEESSWRFPVELAVLLWTLMFHFIYVRLRRHEAKKSEARA